MVPLLTLFSMIYFLLKIDNILQNAVFALYFTTYFRQLLNCRVDLITMRTFEVFTGFFKDLFEQGLSIDIIILQSLHFMGILFDIFIGE